MTEQTVAELQFQVRWPVDATRNPSLVNQVAVAQPPNGAQGDADPGIYMMLGHVMAPLFAREEDAREFFGATFPTGVLDVDSIGSFYLARHKAFELFQALGAALGIQVQLPEQDQAND